MESPETIKELAVSARKIAEMRLKVDRLKRGYVAYIHDLRDKPSINADDPSAPWSFARGLITVKLPVTDETAAEVKSFLDMNLGGAPWYKPSSMDSIPSPELEKSFYPNNFGILGKPGSNSAVDPTLFLITPGEPARLLSIIRVSGERALPGGMVDEGVKQKCIDELLEECFSGKFFVQDSETSRFVDDRAVEILANNQAILREKCLSALASCELNVAEKELVKAYMNSMTFVEGMTASDCIRQMLDHLPLDGVKKNQTTAHLRVELYKTLCKDHYTVVTDLIKPLMRLGPVVINYSDPRNTQTRWMQTQSVGMAVTPDVLAVLEQCGLEKNAAADDATHAHFPTLAEFCSDPDRPPFSDHAGLVLDALAKQVEEHVISIDEKMEEELGTIRQNFSVQRSRLLGEIVSLQRLSSEPEEFVLGKRPSSS